MSNSFSAWRGLSLGLVVVAISASALADSVTNRPSPVKSLPLVVPAPEPPKVAEVVNPDSKCSTVTVREEYYAQDSPSRFTYISPIQVNSACVGPLFAAGVFSAVPNQKITHVTTTTTCP